MLYLKKFSGGIPDIIMFLRVGWTDGQPQNIMPLATAAASWRHKVGNYCVVTAETEHTLVSGS